MIPELGHFALILALAVALVQGTLPLVGAARGDARLMALGSTAALTQALLVVVAFAALTQAYVTSDFSVANVVANSHSAKPLVYKISGVWGNHEGSMLLWALILAVFGAAVALFGANLPDTLRARVLAIQALIGMGFLAFLLFTSNPFERLSPAPADGNGLNPLLQDPGLAFHPPLLYLGYVGFSVTYAFAIAALLEGRVDPAWARWVRPWTLAAWCFLTLGIALGSWWAYYILGWGGFWFWDPVENASLMPWLAGTALLHSAIVVEKRDALKSWTVLLAILAFSLSLLGTFLVRSGVLTSVHAFAQDPARGLYILAFLLTVTGGGLALYAWRAPKLTSSGLFQPISREGALILNNLLLCTLAATVLLGTLYPLFLDLLTGNKVSVGPPFFNATFVPICAPLFAALCVGPFLGWKRAELWPALQQLRIAFFVAVVAAIVAAVAIDSRSTLAAVAFGFGVWLIMGSLVEFAGRLRLGRAPWSESLRRLRATPRASLGMTISHAALGVVVLGAVATGAWHLEVIETLKPGEKTRIAGYDVTLVRVDNVQGPNYVAERAILAVTVGGRPFTMLRARAPPVHGAAPPGRRDRHPHQRFARSLRRSGRGRSQHRLGRPALSQSAGAMDLAGRRALRLRRLRVVERPPPQDRRTLAPAGGTGGRMIMFLPSAPSSVGRLLFLLPLATLALMAGFFAWSLMAGRDPASIGSVMVGRPAPRLDLRALRDGDKPLTDALLRTGKPTIVNFFASWCTPCLAEHPLFTRLAQRDGAVIIGIAWKNKPEEARAWLAKLGDPFLYAGQDFDGRTGLDWGLSGVPETYLIDGNGIVRFHFRGPITEKDVRDTVLPFLKGGKP